MNYHHLIFYLAVFFFGTSIGSFLNVCIYRIPRHKSIVFPGSACPSCNHKLPYYCNIPILSYLFLKGKCKFCKSPISIRYPFIESLIGFIAVVLVLKFKLTLVAGYWFLFCSTLIMVSFIDIDFQIIPNIISFPGIIFFASSFLCLPTMSFFSTIIGISLGGGLLYIVSTLYFFIKKQKGLGGGDIKLLAMIGAALGWKGVFFTVFTGSFIGSIVGIIIMALTNKSITFKIPFGPYLSIGAILYIFWGQKLISWYLNLCC